MIRNLLIGFALCTSMLGAPCVSNAQACGAYQWYGAETFVYFQLNVGTALVIYGNAGHAFSESTAGSGSMAHMGRSFWPTRWEVITDSSTSSKPGRRWAIEMRQTRRHNPCGTPEFIDPLNASVFNVNLAEYDPGSDPPSFSWKSGGNFNTSTTGGALNSFPGEWSIKVGYADSSGLIINTLVYEKGYFYSVADNGYATNPKYQPPDNDWWGNEPGGFNEGPGASPGEGSAGGGLTPDDLNNQNVNQEGFWQSLFAPSEEMWDAFINKVQELQNWGPFGFMTIFAAITEEYEAEGDGYVLKFPFNNGVAPLEIDMTQYSGFIIFMRHLAAGVLWFTVIMQVKNRFIQKV